MGVLISIPHLCPDRFPAPVEGCASGILSGCPVFNIRLMHRCCMQERDGMNELSSRWRLGVAASALAAAAVVFLATPLPARAQDDIQSLSDKVDRLQQELSDVERQVYNGQGPAGPAAASVDTSATASQEVRIQQLESQLSSITGQIEQLNYKLQQLSTRLDKM